MINRELKSRGEAVCAAMIVKLENAQPVLSGYANTRCRLSTIRLPFAVFRHPQAMVHRVSRAAFRRPGFRVVQLSTARRVTRSPGLCSTGMNTRLQPCTGPFAFSRRRCCLLSALFTTNRVRGSRIFCPTLRGFPALSGAVPGPLESVDNKVQRAASTHTSSSRCLSSEFL